jgi:hypothetical protein
MSAVLATRRRPRTRPRTRTIVGLLVLAAVLLLIGANAHLLYVAVTSQPDCVDHVRQGEAASGTFRAAKSACSPGARS